MIKLNWTRGKNLGLALIFLGVMGLVQTIFIAFGQYQMGVGSIFIAILIPIGIIFATFYSIIVIFESGISMNSYRSKKLTAKEVFNVKSPFLKPILHVVVVFIVSFTIVAIFTNLILDDSRLVFIIAENLAAFACLIWANYYEARNLKK